MNVPWAIPGEHEIALERRTDRINQRVKSVAAQVGVPLQAVRTMLTSRQLHVKNGLSGLNGLMEKLKDLRYAKVQPATASSLFRT